MGWHLSAAKHPTHTLAWGKIIERGKVRKLVGCYSLKRRERKEKKWCKGNNTPSPTSKTMPSQPVSNDQLGNQPPPTSSFPYPSVYCWAWLYMVWKIPWGDSHPLPQLRPLPAPCPPLPSHCGGTMSKRQSLQAAQAPSAITKPLLCFRHSCSHKSKTQHWVTSILLDPAHSSSKVI